MEKKFSYSPKAYKNMPKDFMGNLLSVGDMVVISERTYSKTPYMVYGEVKKIDVETKKKDGLLKSFTVYIFPMGQSDGTDGFVSGNYMDDYDSVEDMYEDFGHPDDEDSWESYSFNAKSFINILKVNK